MKHIEYAEWKKVEGKSHYKKEYIGKALFHQFGTDYEEFETGPGNFSTAIIELPDGSVKNIEVSLIKFINPQPTKE